MHARRLALCAIVTLVLALALPACGSNGAGGSAPDAGLDATVDAPVTPGDDGGGAGDDADQGDAISVQPPVDDADTPPSEDAGSPGGPWVAFVSNRTGSYDIYLVHPDGTGLQPLVTGAGEDLYPSWSPDGARLAFASTRASDAGTFQIYVVDVASGAITPTSTGLSDAVSPAWSPDGTTLALGGPGGLYVVGATGGAATPLTTGGYRDNSPAWSPDGSLVYFSSDRGDAGAFDVWSVQVAGGAIQQVTTGTNILGGPAVSPDGGTIALAQGSPTQVAFWSLATKASAVFTAMGDYEPAFAPSGAQLAVTSTRYAADNPDVVLLGIPGATSPFRLTDSPGVDGQAAFQPAH